MYISLNVYSLIMDSFEQIFIDNDEEHFRLYARVPRSLAFLFFGSYSTVSLSFCDPDMPAYASVFAGVQVLRPSVNRKARAMIKNRFRVG